MTKREAILQALFEATNSITGLPAFRSRTEPFAKGKAPAMVLEPIQDVAEQEYAGTNAPITWALQVRFTIIVRETPGALPADPYNPVDTVSDQYVEALHAAVMADVGLGGLSMDILPLSVNYEIIDADNTLGLISLDFKVTYRTAFASLV